MTSLCAEGWGSRLAARWQRTRTGSRGLACAATFRDTRRSVLGSISGRSAGSRGLPSPGNPGTEPRLQHNEYKASYPGLQQSLDLPSLVPRPFYTRVCVFPLNRMREREKEGSGE